MKTWINEQKQTNKQTNKQAKNRRILDKFVMFSLSKPSRLSTRYHKPLVYTYKVVLIELLYYYSISALMPGGLLQKIDKEQLDAHLLNEITCIRDWPLEKLWRRGGGEFSSRRNFFSLSNSLYGFFLDRSMNIFWG